MIRYLGESKGIIFSEKKAAARISAIQGANIVDIKNYIFGQICLSPGV